MNPNELRALADALYFQGRYGNETERQAATRRVEERKRAADYLRACADAQPVRAVPLGHALSAVRHVGSANYPDRERAAIERLYSAEFDAYAHPAPAAPQPVPAGWKWVPVEPTQAMNNAGLSAVNQYGKRSVWETYAAMLAAAPAAPQAEPIDPHMIVAEDRFPDVPAERWKPCPQCGEDFDRECPICDGLGKVLATDGEQAEPITDSDADYWLRNRQAILDAIERAGFVLMSNASGFWLHPRGATDAQAEPKREPLSDERIDAALQTDPAMILALMNGEMTVGEFKAALRRLARTVEHAHGISGGGHD